jgi:RES domain-containing protein
MYPIRLLDQLESIEGKPWEGIVWRHMFGDTPPNRENVSGARWNPRDVPAIYTSFERSVAIAEGDYLISIQPVRPSARRVLHTVKVRLHSVVDLCDRELLADLGVGQEELGATDHTACRQVGGAVEWLGHDGLLVPSARSPGTNLVIYTRRNQPDSDFETLAAEPLTIAPG